MILNGTAGLQKKVDTKQRIFVGVGSRRVAAILASFAVSIPFAHQVVDTGSTQSNHNHDYGKGHGRGARRLIAVRKVYGSKVSWHDWHNFRGIVGLACKLRRIS